MFLTVLIAASVKFSFKLNIGCPKNYEPQKVCTKLGKKK